MKAGLQARFRPQHCKSPSTPKPPRIWRAHDPCRQLLLLCWCASVAHSRPGSSVLVATQERIPACSDCGRAAGNRGFRLARRLESAVMWRRQRPAIRSALDRNSHMPPNPTTPIVPVFAKPGVLNRLLQSLSIFTMVMTVPQVLTIWVSHRAAGISMLSWGAYLGSRSYGFGTDYRSATRTSTCHASVGCSSTLPCLSEL